MHMNGTAVVGEKLVSTPRAGDALDQVLKRLNEDSYIIHEGRRFFCAVDFLLRAEFVIGRVKNHAMTFTYAKSVKPRDKVMTKLKGVSGRTRWYFAERHQKSFLEFLIEKSAPTKVAAEEPARVAMAAPAPAPAPAPTPALEASEEVLAVTLSADHLKVIERIRTEGLPLTARALVIKHRWKGVDPADIGYILTSEAKKHKHPIYYGDGVNHYIPATVNKLLDYFGGLSVKGTV